MNAAFSHRGSVTAADVVMAVRDRGSNAEDIRDAVHEAYHGVTASAERWDRQSVHDAVARCIAPALRGRNELEARAAEWAACDRFGVDYAVGEWAALACLEAARDNVWFPTHAEAVSRIRSIREQKGDVLLDLVLSFLS